MEPANNEDNFMEDSPLDLSLKRTSTPLIHGRQEAGQAIVHYISSERPCPCIPRPVRPKDVTPTYKPIKVLGHCFESQLTFFILYEAPDGSRMTTWINRKAAFELQPHELLTEYMDCLYLNHHDKLVVLSEQDRFDWSLAVSQRAKLARECANVRSFHIISHCPDVPNDAAYPGNRYNPQYNPNNQSQELV